MIAQSLESDFKSGEIKTTYKSSEGNKNEIENKPDSLESESMEKRIVEEYRTACLCRGLLIAFNLVTLYKSSDDSFSYPQHAFVCPVQFTKMTDISGKIWLKFFEMD